jgi:ubiquinone/menaquinone biosynthesis C-methylase UbiE
MPAKHRTAASKKRAPSKKAAPRRAARPAKKGPYGAKRDRHGNPTDFDAYLARLDDPGRAEWQLPDRVVAALRLKKGGLAAEVGSGTGQFTVRMAKKVGEDGRVYAIDVEPRMLEVLAERAAAAKAWGIVGLLAPDGGGLPPEPVDVVLMVNVLHHVHGRADYLRALGKRLAPGGRIAIVDFHERALPIGPPPDHKLARADALAAVKAAGLSVLREEKFLPYQYFLIAGRAPAKA